MATYMPTEFGNYKSTETYRKADSKTRTQIERWKNDQKLTNAQAHMLLTLQDLKNLSKEEKKASNRSAETICVTSMLIFFMAYISESRGMLLMASCMIILSVITYVTGIFNPISNTQRAIRKKLKKLPEAIAFDKWQEAQ